MKVWGPIIFLFVCIANDFEAMIAHLEAHHVKIEFAKKRPKSWSLYFYDLDGNKLEATAWPLEDGVPEEKGSKKFTIVTQNHGRLINMTVYPQEGSKAPDFTTEL